MASVSENAVQVQQKISMTRNLVFGNCRTQTQRDHNVNNREKPWDRFAARSSECQRRLKQIWTDPNSVPACDALGNTRITWQRQAGITAQLCVAEKGGEEKLIGQGSKDALNARCFLKGPQLAL